MPRHRSQAAALLVISATTALSSSALAAESAKWTLVWSDEFDEPTLDTSNWTAQVMPDPHNEDLQYYTDRTDSQDGANAWIDDGVLVLEARSETFEHRHYTSARLITKGKREFHYGRFEARMRLASETGMWPAFWLLGANIDEVGWPACGEIDVMEGKGRLPGWTSGALHRGPDPESNTISSSEHAPDGVDFQRDWHRFAVEWSPGTLRWLVDDVEFYSLTRDTTADEFWPFDQDHPFFLIINLAVGGWFDKPHRPPFDMSPQRLLVDWVRVSQSAATALPN
jgi:beta-glucanase (GH16 family)